jgi:hypothetical protein
MDTSNFDGGEVALKKRHAIDEEFRLYRQSNLALSATLLALSGLLFKVIIDIPTFPIAHTCLTFFWFTSLTISAISAVGVQVCHVMGYKNMARRHYPPEPEKDKNAISEWREKYWKIGNAWFTGEDVCVWISIAGILIGFLSTASLWWIVKAG